MCVVFESVNFYFRIQAQPITHTVYTDDGQKVSVDINLKMISPTPSHPAGGATLHSNPQHHPPPQFRPADYRPDDQHYNYHVSIYHILQNTCSSPNRCPPNIWITYLKSVDQIYLSKLFNDLLNAVLTICLLIHMK